MLFTGCIQRKKNIDLKSENTVIFHLNKADSSIYRKWGDSAYYIKPLVFKPDPEVHSYKVLSKDIENSVISGDSFWNKWWENRDVEYKFYLLMTDGEAEKGDLIPLKDEFYGTLELDRVDY